MFLNGLKWLKDKPIIYYIDIVYRNDSYYYNHYYSHALYYQSQTL